MKKTLILLFVAIGLGVFTYYHEELGTERKLAKEKKQKALFDAADLGGFVGVKFPKLTIKKIDNRFRVLETNQLVDERKFQGVLDQLGQLQVKKIVENTNGSGGQAPKLERQLFIPDDTHQFIFLFEKGEIPVTLGKKLEYDQAFYIEIKSPKETKIVLAVDASPETRPMTERDHELNPYKYKDLITTIHLMPSFYYDNHVWRSLDHYPHPKRIESVSIENNRNIKMLIDYKQGTISPSPPAGVQLLAEAFPDFAKALLQMEGGRVIDGELAKDIEGQIARLELQYQGKLATLQLFRKVKVQRKIPDPKNPLKFKIVTDQLDGHFIKTNLEKDLFEVSSSQAKILFSSAQEFYEKRIYKNFADQTLTLDGDREEKFGISFPGGEKADLVIPRGDDFQVVMAQENSKYHPQNKTFSELFSFLFTPGERVSSIDKEDLGLLNKAFMVLHHGNHLIHLIYNERELLVMDPLNKIKINYYVGSDLPVATEASAYLGP